MFEVVDPAKHIPLAYLSPTEFGTAVVVLRRSRPDAPVVVEAEVAALSDADLVEVLVRERAGFEGGYLMVQRAVVDSRGSELTQALSALGPLAQIIDRLAAHSTLERMAIVAGGLLGVFPLAHCPWSEDDHDRCLADRVTTSYAPSARVLVHGRKVAEAGFPRPATVAVAAYSPTLSTPWSRPDSAEAAPTYLVRQSKPGSPPAAFRGAIRP